MSEASQVWDVGLQLERTGLAWQRLALSMLGIGVALPRLIAPTLGWWCLPATLVLLACSALLLAFGDRRYVSVHRSLTASDSPPSGGRLPLAVTLATVVVGLTAVAYVL